MYKLKKMLLKNYCGYRDTEFDFDSQFNMFYGPNGIGKSTNLNAIELLCNAKMYEGRETDLIFRKLTFSENYDPKYSEFQDAILGKRALENPMHIAGLFEDENGDKAEVIIESDGVKKNELPKKHSGHCYYIDADHPINMSKFQMENTPFADKFLELAEIVYNMRCYYDKEITDGGKGWFTDIVLEKWGTHVHHKSMSDGEKKICALIKGLCDPEYMPNTKIVLIDNIAMHIYFKRHARLVDKMLEAFPDKQFFTTTHSGDLVRYIDKSQKYDIEDIREEELKKLGIPFDEG